MNLSEHFTLEELCASETATRKGIDNVPADVIKDNLATLAAGMEQVRALLGNRPVRILSGYRSASLNAAVGGARNSAHMSGYAADFICPEFGVPLVLVQYLADSSLGFDQCIQEGTWVHLSFAPAGRREILTAHFGPGGTTYTHGVG